MYRISPSVALCRLSSFYIEDGAPTVVHQRCKKEALWATPHVSLPLHLRSPAVNQVDCDASKKCNGVEKLPDAPKDWRMCTVGATQMVWR